MNYPFNFVTYNAKTFYNWKVLTRKGRIVCIENVLLDHRGETPEDIRRHLSGLCNIVSVAKRASEPELHFTHLTTCILLKPYLKRIVSVTFMLYAYNNWSFDRFRMKLIGREAPMTEANFQRLCKEEDITFKQISEDPVDVYTCWHAASFSYMFLTKPQLKLIHARVEPSYTYISDNEKLLLLIKCRLTVLPFGDRMFVPSMLVTETQMHEDMAFVKLKERVDC